MPHDLPGRGGRVNTHNSTRREDVASVYNSDEKKTKKKKTKKKKRKASGSTLGGASVGGGT